MEINYQYLFQIILTGDSKTGKSSFFQKYTENYFNENEKSTIGVDFKTKYLKIQTIGIKLILWDTGGEERFRKITTTYYRGASGIIVFYDISNRQSFENIESWIREIENTTSIDKMGITIVGNKSDKIKEREVSLEEGRLKAERLGIIRI